MSTVSTHVLDTSTGRPGAGIGVRLFRAGDPAELIASGTTDRDGRVAELGPDDLPAGVYRLAFDSGAHFAAAGVETFFPTVEIAFTVQSGQHYHVPVLLSPFAYSTYRGS